MVLVDGKGIVRLYNPGNGSYELPAAKIESAQRGSRAFSPAQLIAADEVKLSQPVDDAVFEVPSETRNGPRPEGKDRRR